MNRKRLTLALCLSLGSAPWVFADHHGGEKALGEKLDALLTEIAQPDEAKRYEPRMAVQDLTSAASKPGAGQRDAYVALLLARLEADETSQAGRAWILRQLENIGGAESVPALRHLMGSPFHHLRELARRALEQNPSAEAGAAIRELASSEQDRRLKRALVHSLGQRRDADAVALLVELAGSKDPALSGESVQALGKIASNEAVAALQKLYAEADGRVQEAAADALFVASRRSSTDQAVGILEELYRFDQPGRVQAAALRGLVRAQPENADDLILLALQSKETAVRQAAINACRGLAADSVMPNVLAVKLSDLEDREKAMALAVLAESADATVASQLGESLEAGAFSEDLELTVIAVLGRLGGVDAAGRMLDFAGRTEDEELRDGAREALAQMPGDAVDAALLAATRVGDVDVRREAIQALGARGTASAVPVLFEHVEQGPRAIRSASLSALGELVDAGDLPRLTSHLRADDTDAIRAVMQVCRQTGDQEIAARAIIAAVEAQADASIKASLLSCLGILGGEAALKRVESYLKNEELKEAAMKTLTSWRGPEAGALFIRLAADKGISETNRTLILRGLARLLGNRDSGMESDQRLDYALKGLELARRPADQRLFFPVLGGMRSPEAVEALVKLLEIEEHAEEAGLAILGVVERMGGRRRGARMKQQLLKAVIRAEVEEDTAKRAQEMLDKL